MFMTWNLFRYVHFGLCSVSLKKAYIYFWEFVLYVLHYHPQDPLPPPTIAVSVLLNILDYYYYYYYYYYY